MDFGTGFFHKTPSEDSGSGSGGPHSGGSSGPPLTDSPKTGDSLSTASTSSFFPTNIISSVGAMGAQVGSSVGATVGAMSSTVGATVGAMGSTVGATVGAVGSTVSATVEAVGSTVGATVEAVGSTVGAMGAQVGASVGAVGYVCVEMLSVFCLNSLIFMLRKNQFRTI